jgi:hypothetical protein
MMINFIKNPFVPVESMHHIVDMVNDKKKYKRVL